MAKIKSFNKENLQMLRPELSAAINKVCKKYGMNDVNIGNISYLADSFNAKITFNLERKDFNLAVATEKPESFIGRMFKQNQRTFTIERFDSMKNRLVGRTNRGKGYLLTPEQLLTMREVKF